MFAAIRRKQPRPTLVMIACEYDPAWPLAFAEIRRVLLSHLESLAVEVHHVGSTSIPGMLAKPILDIDIEISNYEAFPAVVERLLSLGYAHEGDLGIADRYAFRRLSPQAPQIDPPRTWTEQHLYVCPTSSRELQRQLLFRDKLRVDANLRARYRDLKLDCLAQCNGQRKIYQSLKEQNGSAFFADVLQG